MLKDNNRKSKKYVLQNVHVKLESTTNGPCSVKRANNEDAPGPPWSHITTGAASNCSCVIKRNERRDNLLRIKLHLQ